MQLLAIHRPCRRRQFTFLEFLQEKVMDARAIGFTLTYTVKSGVDEGHSVISVLEEPTSNGSPVAGGKKAYEYVYHWPSAELVAQSGAGAESPLGVYERAVSFCPGR